MSAAYRLTPEARDGFQRIACDAEERFGPEVADKVVEAIETAFERLTSNPAIGHSREDLTQDERIRFWSVGPTLLAYRTQPKWVEIVFVERGEMDWERMLIKSRE